MIRSADEFVELRTSENPELYTRAAQDSAPVEVWLEVIEKHPEMKTWVVHNKTVPGSVLKVLMGDPDPAVRSAVARKRKADNSILETLATDQDGSVLLAVASNKKTPLFLLRRLAKDSWDRVADVANEQLANKL